MQSELLDFDTLMEMAQKSPDKLELLRKRMIKEVIDGARGSSRRRLEGLQFKIDMEIRRSKTPLASCIRISQMMHESMADLRDYLDVNKTIPQPVLLGSNNVICFHAGKEKLKHNALMAN